MKSPLTAMPRMLFQFVLKVICFATCIVACGTPLYSASHEVDFNRDIRPILSDRCFQCHGPDSAHREAGLRLDREESALAERDGYHVVVAGKPDQSELVRRITSDDASIRMPPPHLDKDLSEDEIELLQRWIAQGAEWSLPWAYVSPARHQPPEVSDSQWVNNWIDRFLLARLDAEGLEPSPPAEPVTLIRRLHFDLAGLPPSPDEVTAFVADPSKENYERVVDRLLNSPHFGERMATYWLDLVRYADSVGYHGDQEHRIWPYRDYVIHAFNTNKPFDEFTREQLAGDLLRSPTVDDMIASGYNRLLQTTHEGGLQLKEYRAIYMADRVRNVSQVWMGATVGCAQCHDHKFDPYTMRDFYSLGAFFADIDDEEHLRKPGASGLNSVVSNRFPEMEVLSVYQRERLAEINAEMEQLSPEEDTGELNELRAERDELLQARSGTMVSRPSAPRVVRVLPRGNWLDETGPVVQPAVPDFLGQLEVGGRRANRLDLANWLTEPDDAGMLTARVMVNRYWHLLFGQGIAAVLDDFGGQGAPPVYPELLDRLAIEYVDSGWDTKHMLKLMVMSRAYQQSSQMTPELRLRDPENRLVARQSRFRLPAEAVRDTALSVSGLLVDKRGGASVKPHQPKGLYKHLNFPQREYQPDTEERQWRRGVYVHRQRQYLHPMLKAFDAPSREECEAQRPQSNTPLASLTLLNDPSFVAAARALAQLVVAQDVIDTEERLEFMFRRAFSRSPDDFELETLTELLDENRQHYQSAPGDAVELLDGGLDLSSAGIQSTGADPAELAAWTMVARAVLNSSEALTRN